MATFEISAEDVARGTLLKPGWYPFRVKSVEDKPGKDKPSTTVAHVTMVIEKAEDDSGEVVENVPLMAYFPDTNPSGAIQFCNAFGENIGKGGKSGVEIGDKHVGLRAEVFVKRGEYQGRGTNNAADFRPL